MNLQRHLLRSFPADALPKAPSEPATPTLPPPTPARLFTRFRDKEQEPEKKEISEEAFKARLIQNLREIAAEFPSTIVNPLPEKKLAQELKDSIRQKLGLKDDAAVEFTSVVSASRSFEKAHASQPWTGDGKFTIHVGEGEKAFVIKASISLTAGMPADIEIRETNWANADARATLLANLAPGRKGPLNTKESPGEVARQQVARLVLSAADKAVLEEGKKLRNELAFLRDPALGQVGEVFLIVSSEAAKLDLSTVALRTEEQRAEAAVWVSRWLSARRETPSAPSVKTALAAIDELRRSVGSTPLFFERNIVVAADAQLLLGLERGEKRSELPLLFRMRQDIHVFGTEATIKQLRVAAGTDGDVELIRPQASLRSSVESLLTLHSLGGKLLDASTRTKADSERRMDAERILKADFRHLFRLEDGESLSVKVSRNEADPKTFSVSFTSGRKVIGDFEFTESDSGGTLKTSSINPQLDDRHPELTPKDASARMLEAIERTAPGKNGFLFIFDGHGNPSELSVSSSGTDKSGHALGSSFLTAKQVAGAIRARAERFDTGKDVYIFESCFSKDFIDEIAKHLQGMEGAPILVSTTEHGQLAAFNPAEKIPGRDLDILLKQADPEKKRLLPPSLRDLMDVWQRHPDRLFSNPTFWVPRTGPKEKVIGYDQISQGGASNSERQNT